MVSLRGISIGAMILFLPLDLIFFRIRMVCVASYMYIIAVVRHKADSGMDGRAYRLYRDHYEYKWLQATKTLEGHNPNYSLRSIALPKGPS
ncbi:hypothetical protein EYC80_005904 [Monilinia laxa]|uniref:Uncharacterized protein n=1 Tax=Monilinia laxa TaxID=61186 RepID=A0A5N6KFP0_MONLA|nr:hypothetical protein EYC80_005904 [Monilinia laxa]